MFWRCRQAERGVTTRTITTSFVELAKCSQQENHCSALYLCGVTREGGFLLNFFFFLVQQGNVRIALGKKSTSQNKTTHHFFHYTKHFFFFFCGFPLLLLFISYFIPVYPYIYAYVDLLYLSVSVVWLKDIRSFNERPFTWAGSKPTGRLAKVMSQDMM